MEDKIYIVHSADTLFGIARDQLGDPMLYRSLKEWNNLPGLALRPGQKLFLFDPQKGERGGN